ncbi:DUF790 family protein [Neobacillus niacini]|uniref:DUF790 family protein n=1 Tax=Neobacillus niacini TaxID=86668 RepID=UPI0007AC041A|nr:DUF790 family protein [Neobacillus niacini]MEC1526074.1 DUF790 family protein [Neobacillus niacini]
MFVKMGKITAEYRDRIQHIETQGYYRYCVKGNAWKCLEIFLKRFPEFFTLIDFIQIEGEAEKYIFVINSKMDDEMDKILKYKNLNPAKYHRELTEGRILTFYIGFLNNPRQYSLQEHPVRNAFRLAESAGIRVGYYYYHEKPDPDRYSYISLSNIRSFPIDEDEYGDFSYSAGGFRTDLDPGFKSSWEANIARILNYQGVEWKYEKGTKIYDSELGAYIPDFIVYRGGEVHVIEVKGRWDQRSVKKVSAAITQAKEEKIIIIDSDYYSLLEEKFKESFPNWETSKIGNNTSFELPVIGITIGKRRMNVKKLSTGESLMLIRQPNNPYDRNAILVTTMNGEDWICCKGMGQYLFV